MRTKKSSHLFASQEAFTAKNHSFPYDLDETAGNPLCLPRARLDTNSSNSHYLSHKQWAELIVPTDQSDKMLTNFNWPNFQWDFSTSLRPLSFGASLSLCKHCHVVQPALHCPFWESTSHKGIPCSTVWSCHLLTSLPNTWLPLALCIPP